MKRAVLLGVVAVATVVLLAPPVAAQQAGKVLLIIRDTAISETVPGAVAFMITNEAGVIRDTLRKAGYQVDVASPTGERWGTAKDFLVPDHALKNVNVADYKAFVIPCLGIEKETLHPDLAAIIKTAAAKGKIIAAQNGGVTMLAKAGVLAGKKYAAVNVSVMDFKDGIYSGSGVVRDGAIITSGICPGMGAQFKGMQDGTPKLLDTLLAALKPTT